MSTSDHDHPTAPSDSTVWAPVGRVTAVQAVVEKLLSLIRDGVLKPGDKLPPERVLVDRLSVGRSSIREAIQVLATLNVVVPWPGHGTFVKEPELGKLLRADIIAFLIGTSFARELLEARQIIEPAAVRLACLRGTAEEFERIEQLLQDHRRALAEGRPIQDYAAQFHGLLAQASHNAVITQFMSSIIEILAQRGRDTDRIEGYAEIEHREHCEIFALVRGGDADGAARYLFDHVVRSAVTFDVDLPKAMAPSTDAATETGAVARHAGDLGRQAG